MGQDGGKAGSGLRTQGPRGLGLGSRNLATHSTNVALGGRPLFRGFVVFPCRLLHKHSVCQDWRRRQFDWKNTHKTCVSFGLGDGHSRLHYLTQRTALQNPARWVGIYNGDCKNATMETGKSVRLAVL